MVHVNRKKKKKKEKEMKSWTLLGEHVFGYTDG